MATRSVGLRVRRAASLVPDGCKVDANGPHVPSHRCAALVASAPLGQSGGSPGIDRQPGWTARARGAR
ncbi:MAG: hypothetical protein MZV63_27045 [Marinilabiliales bacterium]|nr:hypothetical protein [Marinilabiliales bacterium]